MEELNLKLKKLNQAKGFVEQLQKNLLQKIEEKKSKNENYFLEEITYLENKESEKKINREIEVLEEAQKILLGIS